MEFNYNRGGYTRGSGLNRGDCVPRAITIATELPYQIVFDELPENDPLRRKTDISKIKKSFDWEPLIKLEEGLKLTADYFLK